MRTERAIYTEQGRLIRILEAGVHRGIPLSIVDLDFLAGASWSLAWARFQRDIIAPSRQLNIHAAPAELIAAVGTPNVRAFGPVPPAGIEPA